MKKSDYIISQNLYFAYASHLKKVGCFCTVYICHMTKYNVTA